MNPHAALASLRSTMAAPVSYFAVLFCVGRQHVHITLSDPATYANVLRHKCGIAALVCVVWTLAEARLSLLRVPARHGWQPSVIDRPMLAEESAS